MVAVLRFCSVGVFLWFYRDCGSTGFQCSSVKAMLEFKCGSFENINFLLKLLGFYCGAVEVVEVQLEFC